MRVAFDARVLGDRALAERGIGRYVACLLEAFDRAGREVAALRDLPRPPARAVRRMGATVLHSPSIDRVSLRPGAPLVVTVHDLAPLKWPERYLRTGLKHRLRYAAVRRSARAIAPSAAVASDLERLLRIERGRIEVVPEAAAPAFRPVADPRRRLARLDLPERFLLWVGGLDPSDPRKGVEALAEEVARGDGPPLVLAGRVDERGRGLASPGRVVLAGRLEDDELAALYSAADALVFPSDDEGFGLPPVEALACGTPVAAYAAGALPEVLTGARGAELVEPGDLRGLLDAAERLAGSAAEPPARTWDDVARETWAVYERALAG